MLGAVLLFAAATESMGVHALFGAFLLPPRRSPRRAGPPSLGGRGRVFFAFSGMRTEIGLVTSPTDAWMVLAIIAVATIGKLGGTMLGTRLSGFTWRESSALGVLMNARPDGPHVGLEMGVFTPTLFAMMASMALVTTFATSPIFAILAKALPSARSSLPPSGPASLAG